MLAPHTRIPILDSKQLHICFVMQSLNAFATLGLIDTRPIESFKEPRLRRCLARLQNKEGAKVDDFTQDLQYLHRHLLGGRVCEFSDPVSATCHFLTTAVEPRDEISQREIAEACERCVEERKQGMPVTESCTVMFPTPSMCPGQTYQSTVFMLWFVEDRKTPEECEAKMKQQGADCMVVAYHNSEFPL